MVPQVSVGESEFLSAVQRCALSGNVQWLREYGLERSMHEPIFMPFSFCCFAAAFGGRRALARKPRARGTQASLSAAVRLN